MRMVAVPSITARWPWRIPETPRVTKWVTRVTVVVGQGGLQKADSGSEVVNDVGRRLGSSGRSGLKSDFSPIDQGTQL